METIGENLELEDLKSRVADLEQRVKVLEADKQGYAESIFEEKSVEKSSMPDYTEFLDKSRNNEESVAREAESADEERKSIYASEMVHKSFERKLGKTVMSILASILVFISFIRFADVISSELTDMVKTVIMYVVSFAAAGVGLFMSRRSEKYASLFTAIGACGMGSVYITSIVACLVFGIMPKTTFAIVALLWIVFLVFMSKREGRIFTYITYAGIVVSTALATIEWSGLAGLVVYVVSIAALYGVCRTGDYAKDWWMLIQFPIVCAFITINCDSWSIVVTRSVAAVVLLALGAQLLAYKVEEKMVRRLNVTSVVTLGVVGICHLGASFSVIASVVVALLEFALCAFTYRQYNKDYPSVFLSVFVVAAITLPFLNYGDFYEEHLAYFYLPAMFALVMGCRLNSVAMRVAGYVYLALLHFGTFDGMHYAFRVAFYFAAIACVVCWLRKNYSQWEKFVVLALCAWGLLLIYSKDYISVEVLYLAMGTLSLVANTCMFETDAVTHVYEKMSRMVAYALNALMLYFSLLGIHRCCNDIKIVTEIEGTSGVALALVILMSLALAFVNVKRLKSDLPDERSFSLYTCLKITVLLLFILRKLEAVSYVMSIVGIALAVVMVALGFRNKLRTCRVFGLVLCMVCVLKLAVFDIEYSTSIAKPIGLFVAGALCYLISWLYNRLKE